MRYTLDLVLEVDGSLIRQHVTNLTEAGMHMHVSELLMEPLLIVSCTVSESQPFDDGNTTA